MFLKDIYFGSDEREKGFSLVCLLLYQKANFSIFILKDKLLTTKGIVSP